MFDDLNFSIKFFVFFDTLKYLRFILIGWTNRKLMVIDTHFDNSKAKWNNCNFIRSSLHLYNCWFNDIAHIANFYWDAIVRSVWFFFRFKFKFVWKFGFSIKIPTFYIKLGWIPVTDLSEEINKQTRNI